MSDQTELLDIKQAAQFLRVSETSLRRWTNSGQLACLRVGGKRERRFRRSDLLGFLVEQPTAPAAYVSQLPPPPVQSAVIGKIPVSSGTHVCGLYTSDHGRVRQAGAFLADGIRAGSVCYLVAGPDARTGILAHLVKGRPTLQADIDAGRLVLSDYAVSTRAQLDYFETNFVAATRAGADSLRVVGDVSEGRLAKGIALGTVVEYEASYSRLFAQRFPLVTLCQYDVRTLSGRQILDVLRCHQDAFRYPVERLLA